MVCSRGRHAEEGGAPAPLACARRAGTPLNDNNKQPTNKQRERLGVGGAAQRPKGPLVWFHALSIGESAVALPVLFRCLLVCCCVRVCCSAACCALRAPKAYALSTQLYDCGDVNKHAHNKRSTTRACTCC